DLVYAWSSCCEEMTCLCLSFQVAVAETAKEMVAEFMPKLLCGPDMVELAVDAECAQDWDPATVEDCHRPSSSHHHHHHDLDDGQHEYPLGRVGIEA
uniref:Uncharacterized protein n=1 Tax=Aegilops tauschii subsp. strangulata TaxID=200361 RepID=A0A452XLC2_AEGTS